MKTEISAQAERAQAAGGGSKHASVVFEDDYILAVSKPRAMHSVRQREEDELTLADCIADICPDCLTASDDPREAGLVQRLDFFTSGLVLAAKTRGIWEALHQRLLNGRIEKTYLALIEGKLNGRQEINTLIEQTKSGKRMKIARMTEDDIDQPLKKGVFEASTTVTPLADVKGGQIVRAESERTYRHQIRLHLSHSGHPLVGDEQYGATRTLEEFSKGAAGFLLHAESITFQHPQTQELVCLEVKSELIGALIN